MPEALFVGGPLDGQRHIVPGNRSDLEIEYLIPPTLTSADVSDDPESFGLHEISRVSYRQVGHSGDGILIYTPTDRMPSPSEIRAGIQRHQRPPAIEGSCGPECCGRCESAQAVP